jgi:zinc protease
MGYHIPQFDHDDTAAIEVLQAILTGGKSSRLHRALVETGIASAVDSYDLDDKDPSLFIVAVNLQKQKRAAQAEAVILRELSRISKTPVTDKELERAKNRISFAFYEGLNSNSEKANFLGRFETITDNFEKGLQMHIKTQAIKAQDILAVAQKYLRPEGRSTITGVPK